MNGFSRTFHILVYEAHLLGKIKKCMKLLDDSGKYFYIKHYKNGVAPHYHIIFHANVIMRETKVIELFETYVSSKALVNENFSSINDLVEYFLDHGTYKRKEIVSTMKLK